MLFYKCIDSEVMEQILKNHEHIRNLCHKYEQETKTVFNTGIFYIIFHLFLLPSFYSFYRSFYLRSLI